MPSVFDYGIERYSVRNNWLGLHVRYPKDRGLSDIFLMFHQFLWKVSIVFSFNVFNLSRSDS